MRIQKQYPKLFKTVSRVLGARRAVKELKKVIAHTMIIDNTYELRGAFLFDRTPQRHAFWWDIYERTEQGKPYALSK
jgi:hypothetical protein